jgi:MFS family permease
MSVVIKKNLQYYKFCLYGFFKNLRLFDAFLVLFFLEKGFTFFEIGILYSIREIAMIIMEIPSGVIADALGRRRILMASFLFYIISFFAFYFSSLFTGMAIAMVLFALGDAFRTGVHKAMIFHYLKKNGLDDQKVHYYGHTRSWSQLGSAISAILAAILVFYTGSYAYIFLASVIPYLIDLFLIWSYPKYLDGESRSFSLVVLRRHFIDVINAFFQSFRKLKFIRALASTSLYTGYYRAVKDYLQPLLKYFAYMIPVFAYMSNERRTAILIGLIYSLTYLLTSIVSRNSGRFAALFSNPVKPMNLTIILGFIFGVVTGYTFSYGWFILAIIGFVSIMVIENLRKPIGFALVADLSKDRALASTLSTSSQAKSLITAILAPLIGLVADVINPGTGIAVVAILLLMLLPMYWLSKNKG